MSELSYARLKVDQDSSRNVAVVVGLIEKRAFLIVGLDCQRLVVYIAILIDAVFVAEALPEHGSR
jgi:hypothetical protein